MKTLVEHAIRRAIERNFSDASDISVLETSGSRDHDRPSFLQARVRWSSGDLTRIERLAVKRESADVSSRYEVLLPVLGEQGVPVQRLLVTETTDETSYLVFLWMPGESMAQTFVDASMRWELSAHGFTFARALAKVHNLDWRVVAPWMADPESLPEDLVDEQIDGWMEAWVHRASRCPVEFLGRVEAALRWLDEHRPADVSLSLCHGDYRPANVIVDADEVAGIIGWGHALVTDASYDLALLPFEIRQMQLSAEDADLLSQAIFGSYLQSSKRSLGNLQYFAVARLLTAGLETLGSEGLTPDSLAAFTSDAGLLFDAMKQAMTGNQKALWKQ